MLSGQRILLLNAMLVRDYAYNNNQSDLELLIPFDQTISSFCYSNPARSKVSDLIQGWDDAFPVAITPQTDHFALAGLL